jgi:hypothetical protein
MGGNVEVLALLSDSPGTGGNNKVIGNYAEAGTRVVREESHYSKSSNITGECFIVATSYGELLSLVTEGQRCREPKVLMAVIATTPLTGRVTTTRE